jgi:hypothetical protein
VYLRKTGFEVGGFALCHGSYLFFKGQQLFASHNVIEKQESLAGNDDMLAIEIHDRPTPDLTAA